MIQKRKDVDINTAFKDSCQNNSIVLTHTNAQPVSYIDVNGKKKTIAPKTLAPKTLAPRFRKFNVGDTVKVYDKVKNGNDVTIQVFEGIVLRRIGDNNKGIFTVGKSAKGDGIRKTFKFPSSNLEKIEVVRQGKVRKVRKADKKAEAMPHEFF